MYKTPREVEVWSDIDDISRVEQYIEGRLINNYNTVIATIGNCGDIGRS